MVEGLHQRYIDRKKEKSITRMLQALLPGLNRGIHPIGEVFVYHAAGRRRLDHRKHLLGAVPHDGNNFFDTGRVKQCDGMFDERFSGDADQRFKFLHTGGKPRRQNDGAEISVLHGFGGGRGVESTAP
jgi:hypothetical protein